MDDTDDFDFFPAEFGDDGLGMFFRFRCSGFRREQDGDPVHEREIVREDRVDVVFDDVVRFGIYGHHDDMVNVGAAFEQDFVFVKIPPAVVQQLEIGAYDVIVRFEHLDGPIRNVQRDEKKAQLIIELDQHDRGNENRDQQENGEFREYGRAEKEGEFLHMGNIVGKSPKMQVGQIARFMYAKSRAEN